MGLFNKFFKKKKLCPNCGYDISNLTTIVHSSNPIAHCPQCGYNISNKLDFIDTRTNVEKQIEMEASSTLSVDDELLAQRLTFLSRQQDKSGKTITESGSEIRKHGLYLCNNGGTNRMKKIAYRVQFLGGDVRTLQIFWDGICGWMA